MTRAVVVALLLLMVAPPFDNTATIYISETFDAGWAAGLIASDAGYLHVIAPTNVDFYVGVTQKLNVGSSAVTLNENEILNGNLYSVGGGESHIRGLVIDGGLVVDWLCFLNDAGCMNAPGGSSGTVGDGGACYYADGGVIVCGPGGGAEVIAAEFCAAGQCMSDAGKVPAPNAILDGGGGWVQYLIANTVDAGTICLGGVCNTSWPGGGGGGYAIQDGGGGWVQNWIDNFLDAGNGIFNGTLSVMGLATVETLSVTTDAGITGNAYVGGNLNVAGTMEVNGTPIPQTLPNSPWDGGAAEFVSAFIAALSATQVDAGAVNAPTASIGAVTAGTVVAGTSVSAPLASFATALDAGQVNTPIADIGTANVGSTLTGGEVCSGQLDAGLVATPQVNAGELCLGGTCYASLPSGPDAIIDGGAGWLVYAIVNYLDAGNGNFNGWLTVAGTLDAGVVDTPQVNAGEVCLGGTCNSSWPAIPSTTWWIVDGGVGWETYAVINVLDAGIGNFNDLLSTQNGITDFGPVSITGPTYFDGGAFGPYFKAGGNPGVNLSAPIYFGETFIASFAAYINASDGGYMHESAPHAIDFYTEGTQRVLISDGGLTVFRDEGVNGNLYVAGSDGYSHIVGAVIDGGLIVDWLCFLGDAGCMDAPPSGGGGGGGGDVFDGGGPYVFNGLGFPQSYGIVWDAGESLVDYFGDLALHNSPLLMDSTMPFIWGDDVTLDSDGSGNLIVDTPGLGVVLQSQKAIIFDDYGAPSFIFSDGDGGLNILPENTNITYPANVIFNEDPDSDGGYEYFNFQGIIQADGGIFDIAEMWTAVWGIALAYGQTYLQGQQLCLDGIGFPGCLISIQQNGSDALFLNLNNGNWTFQGNAIADAGFFFDVTAIDRVTGAQVSGDAGTFANVSSGGFPVEALVAFDGGAFAANQLPQEVVGSVLSSTSGTVTTNIGHTYSVWNECFCTAETTSVATTDVGCTETLSTVTVPQTVSSTVRIKYDCKGL